MKTITSGVAVAALAMAGFTTVNADWVEESNKHAQPVLEMFAKYGPEGAGQLGVDGYDEEIFDLKPKVFERSQADTKKVIRELNKRLDKEKDPKVRQDLQILLKTAEDSHYTAELNRRLMLPYFNVPQTVFFGMQGLLDPRVDKSRYPAAIVRLRKYTGLERGYEPITELAKARSSERFGVDGLIGPYREQVEKDLQNYERFIGGIKQLLENTELDGWQEAHAALAEQFRDYAAWMRSEMLPRARDNHLLPEEVYADNLKNFGVNMDPRELMERAQFGFMEIRNEMQAIAKQVARQRDYASDDYRDVIRELKKEQLANDELMPFYRERLVELEEIIRNEKIVTLPERDAVIRLASEAESAAIPAPHLNPPRLIGNTGEQAEFVLPLQNPNAASGEKMDDFLYDAVAWTLTVHEARPGHELQFASMIEAGVSVPRAVFAFNSANVEGWALYAEAIMKEYLPPEGQLLSLQGRLMRAARAFIDPMLNLGLINPEEAKRFIMEEVVLSEPMATQEIDRYTFRAPGQATSYYYGHMKMQSLRTRVELALRDKFDQQAFHDFVLAQGLLPPELLEQAVIQDFIPSIN
ncbi:MAG: DUF885 domain-containing protein [Gammaproteobacteria bacterium]|nr:DUF885 domain-containing protein [Gammaproteobacteria bacterium]